jgi:hypothetical protein
MHNQILHNILAYALVQVVAEGCTLDALYYAQAPYTIPSLQI